MQRTIYYSLLVKLRMISRITKIAAFLPKPRVYSLCTGMRV